MSTMTATTTSPMQFDVGSGMGSRKVREPEGHASFDEIPIIDLSDMDSNDEAKLRALASKIYDVCTQVGFFYIKNHGISPETVAQIKREAERFLKGMPLDKKMDVVRDNNEFFLGYAPFRPHGNALNKKPHPYEAFLCGREVAWDPECRGTVDSTHDAHNLWPAGEDIPGFKAQVGNYFGQMLVLCRKMARLFALSLELDPHFFDDKLQKPAAILALNYYAAQSAENPEVKTGIRTHTDHELFTILLQSDGVSALEVVNGNGDWIPAKPLQDTFVVNIGDALSIWTNNIFLSTLHRATNTSSEERYSIPFFFGPDYDCVMETLPSCVSETRPLLYKPITQREHYLSKMNTAYGDTSVAA
ncbi:hypothetical protein PV04_07675 [Phialophora macrospora]|uniref:Fe2OG dioxygenase domain-containing protein n=1 Tax=Phialophora macrospora TaxID=1851006 RepID=A0A0D2DTG0_9EURO|nr:hypothetical protein PV04_07675 [Phialophora macrospora]